jgi:hypothetical protein
MFNISSPEHASRLPVGSSASDYNANERADGSNQHRFPEEQSGNCPSLEAEGFERSHFPGSLAHCHGHGVGQHQQQRKGNRPHDSVHKLLHTAHHGFKAHGKLAFTLGLSRRIRVKKNRVYGFPTTSEPRAVGAGGGARN